MSIWRYADWFGSTPSSCRISLGEGGTPVVRTRRIGAAVGAARLDLKLESVNPTGSYKDRFAAAAVGDMLAKNIRHCVSTSSGNTGSALAAYCAAAGISCEIATVQTAPGGKLQQMMAYGADVYRIEGFGLDSKVTAEAFEMVRRRGGRPGAMMQISAFCCSPAGMAGVKTIGYELAELAKSEGEPIDHVFVQAGGGGLTLAVARGLAEMVERGMLARSPAVHCVQPAGNDTIAGALRRGSQAAQAVQCTTQVSGLQVPSVMDGDAVIAACRASGGTGHVVTDELVWQTHARLAREEGVFCEPAGAVAVAGAMQAMRAGDVPPDARVVCLVTGVGFKDPPSVERMLAGRDCPMRRIADMVDS